MSTLETPKTLIPKNPHASLNTVANIWEKFVGTGELNTEGNLRSVIADRWLRCQELGINPMNRRAQSVISNEEIDNKLHHENLGISGKNVLDRMSDTVIDTGHVIVLADKSGRIIYSVGHQQVQNHLEKINFMPGSEWNEDIVGPNGIGTSLTLGRPELIMGTEHFCQGWQPWVCYGAPIHNPSNHSVLGCIDITGPADKVCVEAMALAISIAQSIESDLSLIQLKRREELRLAFHDFQIKWPNNASFVVDEYGHIIDINSHASRFINGSISILNQPIHMVFPELETTVHESLNDKTEKECEIETNSERLRLVIKPFKTKKGTSGCFIMIVEENYHQHTSMSLQSNEDELIKKALIQTNGNISKAARILNINRTTIYRRRKNWSSSS